MLRTRLIGPQPRRYLAGQPQRTNASLDPSTLKTLLTPILRNDIEISTLDTTIASSECNVLYRVDTSDRNKSVLIEFTQCSDASVPEGKMKGYLTMFSRTPSEVTAPANIGTRSL